MNYKIIEIATEKKTGYAFFLVHFWRGKAAGPPDRINDFMMQLQAKTNDGVSVGLVSIIRANIEAYWKRAEGKDYPPNHADRRIERDYTDPHGVLAQEDVMALKGAEPS